MCPVSADHNDLGVFANMTTSFEEPGQGDVYKELRMGRIWELYCSATCHNGYSNNYCKTSRLNNIYCYS